MKIIVKNLDNRFENLLISFDIHWLSHIAPTLIASIWYLIVKI